MGKKRYGNENNFIIINYKEMKTIYLKMIFTLAITAIALCSACGSSDDPVEFWKPYLVKKYQFHSEKYDKNFYDYVRDNYLETRFNSIIQDPNIYQNAYLYLAKKLCDKLDLSNGSEELPPHATRFINEEYVADHGYYDLKDEVVANIKSHPDLYVENICKIIGPLDDFKAELAKYITAKKVEKENEGGYNRFNVLYSINDEYFVIVCITDKGDGMSEIQFVSDERSINTILDQWSIINL